MLVHDSRIVQVALLEMLQSELSALGFGLLLPNNIYMNVVRGRSLVALCHQAR
jgi:hypothetical protein